MLGGSNNPDVRFRIRAEDWGIECKVAYSPNRGRIRDEIAKKIDQIQAGPAEQGVVAVDLTRLLDHNLPGQFRTPIAEASARIHSQVLSIKESIVEGGYISEKLRRAPKAVAVMFSGHSAFVAEESMALLVSLHVFAAEGFDAKQARWLSRLRLGYEKVIMQGE